MVWFDGEWKEEAAIDVADGGFLRGEGVFETMLGLRGRVFAFAQHWERLEKGARLFGLSLPSFEEGSAICEALLQKKGLTAGEGRVRVRVTRSAGHLLVTATEEEVSGEPLTVVASPFVRNERSVLAGVKAISYGENVLALRHGRETGADEVIFGNTKGEWCEGAWSNVFAVRDGQLFTPPLASGCLPGVTRVIVLELAREKGLVVREEARPLSWLEEVEEMFLTSSLRGVVPVACYEGRSLRMSEVTSQLAAALQERENQGS